MSHRSVALPEQLAILWQVLDDHCVEHGILAGTDSHESVAARVFLLFSNGFTRIGELKAALALGADRSDP